MRRPRRTVEGMDNRDEIRDFLASRRARITPQQAGLPVYGTNRRVLGLRREEVAMLAGVSVEYYTRRSVLAESGQHGGVDPNFPAYSGRTQRHPIRFTRLRRSSLNKQGYLSGGRGESHPPAPTDPGVRVSPHRALVILIIRNRRTTPTARKASGTDGLSAASTPWPSGTPAAVDTSCGANASSSH